MSLNELTRVANKALNALHDSEQLPVQILVVKAERVAEAFPTDPTSVGMRNFLTKRANTQLSISRKEFQQVYHQLYSQNNKFGGYFKEELGLANLSGPKFAVHSSTEGTDLMKSAMEKLGHPVLNNALASVFDKGQAKLYSTAAAKTAERVCLHELNRFAQPYSVETACGQADVIICKATYQTPKGDTTVLVPVEITAEAALKPTVFLSRYGFKDLSKEALEGHIIETAGKSFKVDLGSVLKVVNAAKNGVVEPTSDVSVAIAKMAAASGKPAYSPDGIIYAELGKDVEPIKVPQGTMVDTFAAKLASPAGAAEFKFGKQAVDASRTYIKQSLAGFGFKQANVALENFDSNTLYYAASVDNTASFRVPVKVEAGAPEAPKFIISNGSLYAFSKSGLNDLLTSVDSGDVRVIAASSPVYGESPERLVQQVRQAMLNGNSGEADSVLAVLQGLENKVYFKEAFEVYKAGLAGQLKTASSTCCMQRKVANSKYIMCGHTGLPLHKVFQDKLGHCLPLYRQGQEETEAASFHPSKIFI